MQCSVVCVKPRESNPYNTRPHFGVGRGRRQRAGTVRTLGPAWILRIVLQKLKRSPAPVTVRLGV